MLRDDADGVVAEERRPARHHLVEHRAERVEIAARVGRAAEGLLRRHVGDGADHHPLHGHARAVDGDGEAEVAEGGVAVGVEPDVAGLEVAVDDAATVGVLERQAHLLGDPHRLVGGDAVLLGLREQILDGAAGAVLADDERRASLIAGIEDGDDVGWSPRRPMACASRRTRTMPSASRPSVLIRAKATSRSSFVSWAR